MYTCNQINLSFLCTARVFLVCLSRTKCNQSVIDRWRGHCSEKPSSFYAELLTFKAFFFVATIFLLLHETIIIMSRSLLRHYTLSQVPHQDKGENVQKFIKQSALMMSRQQKSIKLDRKAKEYDLESNTISDANSMAIQLSDPSTDILDGKRAVKKRLEDRKKRRKHLAEMRKSPPHRHSSPSSSRRRYFDRKIEEKKARKRVKERSPPIIQDRSRSKADRIRKESRSKEKEKSTRNKYLDLFQFNGAPSLKRERMTIPQPKLGIFSRGTANPYSVEKPKVQNKKRKTSYSRSTEDEDYESSTTASMSGLPSYKIDEGNPSRIRALEEQIKELQETVKSLNTSNQHKIQVKELNSTNKDQQPHEESAIVTCQSPPTQNNQTVVNVADMPWSRISAQHEPVESGIQDDPPVLAFNGNKPDVHPNGWRAQHKLHDPGLHAIQEQFLDAGGVNFIPAASTSVPRAAQEKNEEDNQKHRLGEAELRLTAAGPCQVGEPLHPVQRQAPATYDIHGSDDGIGNYYIDFVEDHFRNQFALFKYEIPVDIDSKIYERICPRADFRPKAYSLPDTTTAKVEYLNRFDGMPAYDFDKHLSQIELAENLQKEEVYENYTDGFPQQINDEGLNYDQNLLQADQHEVPPRQDANLLDDYMKDEDLVYDYTYQEPLYGEDEYGNNDGNFTNDDSYEHQYADTIYSTEYSPLISHSNRTSKHHELNQNDLEDFWHPHRLI